MSHAADTPEEGSPLPFRCTCGIKFCDETALALHVTHEARIDRERLARDDGAERAERPAKPCLKRIKSPDGRYGFCKLADGHERADSPLQCDGELSEPPSSSHFAPRRK